MVDVTIPPGAKYSAEEVLALPNVKSKASYIEDLRTKGYCVIPSILPKERCDGYVDDALTWLEDFKLGFKRDDNKTWKTECLPIGHKGGLYNQYCCAHEDWVWRVRCEPAVLECFKELWGTDELLVSFDAVNVTFPYGEHGRTDEAWVDPWPHQDQDPHKPVFQLAQGIVALSESGPDDGGLCVMVGSHLLHQQFFAESGGVDESRISALNSYHFNAKEADWYRAHGCHDIKYLQFSFADAKEQIECPQGSLIMWDSRLMHWNRMPTGDRTRVAVYVCYQPVADATPEQVKRKAEVYQNRWVATHWPALNDVRAMYRGGPQRDGKPDPADRKRPIREPVENDTLLKLAGVKAY
ncbi:hypothetical protein BCR39DRAFT_504505 [Naematelia encephala]|uniref:Phytanoyl-CoA dioxygenase n=1 Tax=Naematelia encephala TaxID=71784 RepID=A0A1Y2BBU7_9TREE|nr:hypothetical protein BCR39DRAFT_504505 [Naematelia encephala]